MRNAFLFFFGILLAAPLFAQNAQPSAEFVVLEVFLGSLRVRGSRLPVRSRSRFSALRVEE